MKKYVRKPTYRKRGPGGRRRVYRLRKTYKSGGLSKNLKKDVYAFKRLTDIIKEWTGDNNGQAFGALTFSLNDVVNVSEFQPLFDRYMLTHVQVRFYLQHVPTTNADNFGNFTSSYPRMYYVKDYDDATPPTTFNELREHQRCKTTLIKPNRMNVINIKPAINIDALRNPSGSLFTRNPKWKQWIDMAAPDASHFGLKLAIENLGQNQVVRMEYKYWFKCKDSK